MEVKGSEVREFTIEEVKQHSTKNDCWTLVHGKVRYFKFTVQLLEELFIILILNM
jgi:hypothetical protein